MLMVLAETHVCFTLWLWFLQLYLVQLHAFFGPSTGNFFSKGIVQVLDNRRKGLIKQR
jgi:hypothetical protein